MFNHRSLTSKLILFSLAIALVVVGLGFSAPKSALAATCTQYHTVQRGETLYRIGLRYGVSWVVLAQINGLTNPNLIFAGQKLCVATGGVTPPPAQPAPKTIPTFRIVSVVKDQTVTIETANFPADDTFDVLMGAYSTKGINGIKVATTYSGKGGSFTATYTIPAALHGSYRIAIRLQNNTGSGYYAYNWFYNDTAAGGGLLPTQPGYQGYPTFTIVSVVRDQTVTIRTNNLPPNDSFEVLMGAMGTRGINGIKVATTASGSGGTLTLTYTIPAALKGSYQIAIRLHSPTSGYYCYNWFYNNTTP